MIRRDRQSGFTLIELIVVVMIIGILSAMTLPSYLRSLEVGKADDAVAIMQSVAQANRLFAAGHGDVYAFGTFPNGTCSAASSIPPGTCPGAGWTACHLVGCRYMADQDFSTLPYTVAAAGNNAASAVCGVAGVTGTNAVACVARKSGGSPGTSDATYNVWWYSVARDGVVTKHASAPAVP